MLGPPQDGRALPVSGWVVPYLLPWTWMFLLRTTQSYPSFFSSLPHSRPEQRAVLGLQDSHEAQAPAEGPLLWVTHRCIYVHSKCLYRHHAYISVFFSLRRSHHECSASLYIGPPTLLFFCPSCSVIRLFCVFSSPSSADTSSSSVISALYAYTVCLCVGGSCLQCHLAFSPHGSVECKLPTSCYVCNTLLGVVLQPTVLHTSAIDGTKVFLKIGANSTEGRPRFDDIRAQRLFSASFALTLSSRRFSP